MEPTAAWGGPFELQLATKWPAEEPQADDSQVWAPAVGLPLQYASIFDIFGSCSIQPYAPASSSSGGPQLVEYNYYVNSAAAQHNDPVTERAPMQDLSVEGDYYDKELTDQFEEAVDEFDEDAELRKRKMHRYSPNIRGLGDWYTVPRVVAIGPYHHYGRDHLKPAEKVKHVAAHFCIMESDLKARDVYHKVVSVAAKIKARDLYDKDVMEGIHYDNEFLPMMFYDACFLVMYIRKKSCKELEEVLLDFFQSNEDDIARDIMLLENQIPWPLVRAVMKMSYKSEPFLEDFIAQWKVGFLQDRVGRTVPAVELDKGYEPPHLLGLVRFYVVGKRTSRVNKVSQKDLDEMTSIPLSVSAIELAEMGIHLAANATTELHDMGLASKWIFFAKLSMAPLSLNDLRASQLVNMAAHELCTTPHFLDPAAKYEDSAVCSYLLLLCMLMHKEEDVHELRTNGILQGGAGLTNKKALDFFTSLQSLREGRCYGLVVVEIQKYRNKRWWWITAYGYVYRNWKYITGVVSAIGAFIGIIATLLKLKAAIH